MPFLIYANLVLLAVKQKIMTEDVKIVRTDFGYNFWKGINKDGRPYYNVTPIGQPKPEGGYISAEYICKIKGVPNAFV